MMKWLLLYIIVINIVTYKAYEYDKIAAQANGPSKKMIHPRIAEGKFHALSLFGGWIGAYVAQQTQRHKTVKQPFQRIFWITVAINSIFVLFVFCCR